jgi:hypothetical protein
VWFFRLMAVKLRALRHTEVTFVRPASALLGGSGLEVFAQHAEQRCVRVDFELAAAIYLDRILKGGRPENLPVQEATT